MRAALDVALLKASSAELSVDGVTEAILTVRGEDVIVEQRKNREALLGSR